MLTVQFSLIRRMGALTLPFRGHSGDIADENCGVYMALLKEVAKSNPVLKKTLRQQWKNSLFKRDSNKSTD